MQYQRVLYLNTNKTFLGTDADKEHQTKVILLTAALLRQNQVTDFTELIQLYQTYGFIDPATLAARYPILYEGSTAIKSTASIEAHVLSSGFDVEEKEGAIDILVINNEGIKDEMHTYPNTTLREFIDFYKVMKHLPSKSLLRVKYRGKNLFLSTCGNKTLDELSITHRSYITVSEVQPVSAPPKENVKPKNNQTTRKNGSKKKKGGGKSKKKRSGSCTYATNTTQEDYRVDHSKRLSLIFEEAEPKFKAIRQKLNASTLERTQPKKDRSVSKNGTEDKTETNPTLGGVGSKAGKAVLIPLLAGNAQQLYQSSKTRKQNIGRALSIDLHGCSKDKALDELDRSLPIWVDEAMMGEYPFVVAVDVICGGGNQVLSETVETWVRRNPHVANRPKSFT